MDDYKKLVKIGTTLGIIFPAWILKEAKLKKGDGFAFNFDKRTNEIIITRAK
jgi:antitoxin component of MazEF toxin-antitoxin module